MMAEQTGGQYFHARNQKALLDFFKHLSFKINEQGIDDETLRDDRQPTRTGTYNHAKDIKSLPLILKEINQELQNKNEETIFKSQAPGPRRQAAQHRPEAGPHRRYD